MNYSDTDGRQPSVINGVNMWLVQALATFLCALAAKLFFCIHSCSFVEGAFVAKNAT
jgi:hypothetical protein